MKIKVSQLRKIIAEEVRRVLLEADGPEAKVTELTFDVDPYSDGVVAVVKGSYGDKNFEDARAEWGSPLSGLTTSPDPDFLESIARAIEVALEFEEGTVRGESVDIPNDQWKNWMEENDTYAKQLESQ